MPIHMLMQWKKPFIREYLADINDADLKQLHANRTLLQNISALCLPIFDTRHIKSTSLITTL